MDSKIHNLGEISDPELLDIPKEQSSQSNVINSVPKLVNIPMEIFTEMRALREKMHDAKEINLFDDDSSTNSLHESSKLPVIESYANRRTVNEIPPAVQPKGPLQVEEVIDISDDDEDVLDANAIDPLDIEQANLGSIITVSGGIDMINPAKAVHICGGRGCTFRSESMSKLTEHINECYWLCKACQDHVKSTQSEAFHRKNHCLRYTCSSCVHAFSKETLPFHMEEKHRGLFFSFHPVDINKKNDDKDDFIVKIEPKFKPRSQKTKAASSQPKGKSPQKVNKRLSDHFYGPDDMEKLPMSAIYAFEAKCTLCPFKTKVRSNMMRHLKLHIDAPLKGMTVPTAAPTNPVPCVKGPRMFDKMTNLAASSLAERAPITKLTEAEIARLPQFVPDQQRYKCCAHDCQHITLDEKMLHHHITALHSELSIYRCPHCEIEVPLDDIGHHLKHHGVKLYRCAHCDLFHFLRQAIEKHLSDFHTDKRQFVHTVREPVKQSENVQAFKCLYCSKRLPCDNDTMMDHLLREHSVKGKFKCKECSFNSNTVQGFQAHFSQCHNGHAVKFVKCFTTVHADKTEIVVSAVNESSTVPLWQKPAAGPKTIRGIPIDVEISKNVQTAKKRRSSHGEAKYTCKICHRFSTTSSSLYQEHLNSELSYSQFNCIQCSLPFYSQASALIHAQDMHNGEKKMIKRSKVEPELEFWIQRAIDKQASQNLPDGVAKQKPKIKKVEQVSPTKIENHSKPKIKKTEQVSSSKSTKEDNATKPTTSSRRTLQVSPSKCVESRINCPHCGESSSNISNLKVHISGEHMGLGKYICTKCPRSFQVESLARKHAVTAHNAKAPQELVNANPKALWYQTTEIFWKCHYGLMDPCQTTCSIKDYVSQAVACEVCKGKTLPELMEIHQSLKHKTPSLDCTIAGCNFIGSSSSDLKEHYVKLHCYKLNNPNADVIYEMDYGCYKCRVRTTGEAKILEHVTLKHSQGEGDGEYTWKVQRQSYFCGYCRLRCIDEEKVMSHLSEKHKDLLPIFRFSALAQYFPFSYICQLCNTEFRVSQECYRHVLEAHVTLLLRCLDCDSKFNDVEKLTAHRNITSHTNVPYLTVIFRGKDGDTIHGKVSAFPCELFPAPKPSTSKEWEEPDIVVID